MNKEQIIKIFKNKNNLLIIIIFIIGVVLLAGGVGKGIKSEKKTDTAVVSAENEKEEKRLESILKKIDGAGDVSVMITYYSGVEKTLAYETKTATRETGGERSEDTKAVMTDGEPTVVKEVYPRVKGVIIAADGADSTSVKKAIGEAAAAALDVPAHKICIFKKEED